MQRDFLKIIGVLQPSTDVFVTLVFFTLRHSTCSSVWCETERIIEGPRRLLGYWAMNHVILFTTWLLNWILKDSRQEVSKEKKKKRKERRSPRVILHPKGLYALVASLDGHDKLCCYQNSTFPLGLYGCIYTFSRKILFLLVCHSNSNPL